MGASLQYGGKARVASRNTANAFGRGSESNLRMDCISMNYRFQQQKKMKKIFVSKETCLGCLYGTSGVCEMYDWFAKPMDGETCSDYEEADEDEKTEGQQYADIAPKLEEMSRLQCYQFGTTHGAKELVEQIWRKSDDHPNNNRPYPVFNPDTQEIALAYYDEPDGWKFDRDYKPGRNMLWMDIEKILPKKNLNYEVRQKVNSNN